ncbi:unnamed protein product [Enterobius vermicularis]|uniref:WH2 domain-containing protein n=1 Tax=Enterobius vermicularis TaxID=51028 RepID=A0A0N4VNZ1_ENTVE|nr:unnamed protein product [Enterobius vermicularis]
MKRFLVLVVIYITGSNAFTLPAGLRPAKALGQNNEPIIPGKTSTEMPLKEPANLSIRSRMLAALSASSKETDSDVKPAAESAKNEELEQPEQPEQPPLPPPPAAVSESSTSAPLILTKGGNKKIASQPNKSAKIVIAAGAPANTLTGTDGKRSGAANFGLNTVLHTNLVDSKGRIMKGVNSVPIKVNTATDLKGSQTRHSASPVESEAEKVVPIKFGSS